MLEFLADLGYQVDKRTPKAVEFYTCWDADSKTSVQGDYPACDPDVAERLPIVPWRRREDEVMEPPSRGPQGSGWSYTIKVEVLMNSLVRWSASLRARTMIMNVGLA